MGKFIAFFVLRAQFIWNYLNYLIPKRDCAFVVGFKNLESNTVEFSNYLVDHYALPVYLSVPPEMIGRVRDVVRSEVKLVKYGRIRFIATLLSSKYIFASHAIPVQKTTKRQFYTNIWHGAGHKKIRLARGEGGIAADLTIATSEMTQKMFAEFFGVDLKDMIISGYPRNDLMLRAKRDRKCMRESHLPMLSQYDKILIWMPTYKRVKGGKVLRGIKTDSAFNIPDFDVHRFNEMLKRENAICLLKPHFVQLIEKELQAFDHIRIIDDGWILRQGITLYHLLACTDVLITDFSSVMIDYTLLDQPIMCFSKALEEFKQMQGLYFDDFEDWVPTKFIKQETIFFRQLELLLKENADPYKEKREKIRDCYFKYKDTHSSRRIADRVFGMKHLKTDKKC